MTSAYDVISSAPRNERQADEMQIRCNVPGDGNCFFYCVEDQLDRLDLLAPSAGQLRSDLVVFLQNLVTAYLLFWYMIKMLSPHSTY